MIMKQQPQNETEAFPPNETKLSFQGYFRNCCIGFCVGIGVVVVGIGAIVVVVVSIGTVVVVKVFVVDVIIVGVVIVVIVFGDVVLGVGVVIIVGVGVGGIRPDASTRTTTF